jgi:glycosyltransferase involved in cell wall biosynthesis
MQILHGVTLVGPGNPFGGPPTVAINQARELRARGHHVEVLAGRSREAQLSGWSSDALGVTSFPVHRILPVPGFQMLVSPGLLRQGRRSLRETDIVHIHFVRDLIAFPLAALAMKMGVPYVLQTHGSVHHSERKSAKLLDVLLTKRLLTNAAAVLCLHANEEDLVREVTGDAPIMTVIMPNGVPTPDAPSPMDKQRPMVLFASRLAPLKRPVAFARAAVDLTRSGVDAKFVMLGPDEGEGPAVRAVLARSDSSNLVEWLGPVEQNEVIAWMVRSSLLVLPSSYEPFGMIVLEALAAARAVVVTDACALADFVRSHDCGRVVPPDDQEALCGAIREMLSEPELLEQMGERGFHAVRQNYGMTWIGDELERIYAEALGR